MRRKHPKAGKRFGKTISQISQETGIALLTLKTRAHRHPNITYKELIKPPRTHEKHGYCITHPKLLWIWAAMLQRGLNPNHKAAYNYNKRGIDVCDEWKSMQVFGDWAIAHGYQEGIGLSLERRDNSKGYSPGNCYWASRHAQSRNTRRNRWITYKGKTLCAKDWSRKMGINSSLLTYWLKKGMDYVLQRMEEKLG